MVDCISLDGYRVCFPHFLMSEIIESFQKEELVQSWPLPEVPRPVVIFGAGSIVRDAHLPAYRMANIPVAGIYDPDSAKAQHLCKEWDVPFLSSQSEAVSQSNECFDLATPPAAHAEV